MCSKVERPITAEEERQRMGAKFTCGYEGKILTFVFLQELGPNLSQTRCLSPHLNSFFVSNFSMKNTNTAVM